MSKEKLVTLEVPMEEGAVEKLEKLYEQMKPSMVGKDGREVSYESWLHDLLIEGVQKVIFEDGIRNLIGGLFSGHERCNCESCSDKEKYNGLKLVKGTDTIQ